MLGLAETVSNSLSMLITHLKVATINFINVLFTMNKCLASRTVAIEIYFMHEVLKMGVYVPLIRWCVHLNGFVCEYVF